MNCRLICYRFVTKDLIIPVCDARELILVQQLNSGLTDTPIIKNIEKQIRSVIIVFYRPIKLYCTKQFYIQIDV